MRFNKVSDTELRCRISIEEIKENGLEVSDLVKKDEKVYHFFEDIMAMGEEATGFENNGPMSVEGVFMGNSLELIFRTVSEEDMHKFTEMQAVKEKKAPKFEVKPVLPQWKDGQTSWDTPISISFKNLDSLIGFAKKDTTGRFCASLYRYKDSYIVRYDLKAATKSELGRISQLASEFSGHVEYSHLATVNATSEHGRLITDNLGQFFS